MSWILILITAALAGTTSPTQSEMDAKLAKLTEKDFQRAMRVAEMICTPGYRPAGVSAEQLARMKTVCRCVGMTGKEARECLVGVQRDLVRR